MSSSITSTLFHWMRERELITPVAQRLGIPYSTLVAELRNEPHQAKLGADRLVPIFQALREIESAGESAGIVAGFIRELAGETTVELSPQDFNTQLLTLMKCVGVMSESSARIKDTRSARDLAKLKTMIRAEIIPSIYKMEDVIDDRLAYLHKKPKKADPDSSSQPLPSGA